jgi:hypothetical protein
MPLGIAFIWDFGDHLHNAIHIVFVLLAHMNSSLNPFIYMYLNPGFKTFLDHLKNNQNIQNH